MCPELMCKQSGGINLDDDICYDFRIMSGIDVLTDKFEREFMSIRDASYVFVCLGEDEVNLSVAVRLKTLCERVNYGGDGKKPEIETVIFNSNISRAMSAKWGESVDKDADTHTPEQTNIKKHKKKVYKYGYGLEYEGIENFAGQHVDIHMIGDLDNFYSVESVINSKLVEEGRKIHKTWALENDPDNIEIEEKKFDIYDYYYRSSISKAIHLRLREKLKRIMGLDIPGVGLTREEILNDHDICLKVGRIEHMRWNAYMRSEGYCLSDKRNHLAKQHHNLVSVSQLNEDDLRKDV